MINLNRCLILHFVVVGIIFVSSERKSYEGYALYNVHLENMEQANHLKLLQGNVGVHFLSHILPNNLNQFVNILVSPKTKKEFIHVLRKKNIMFKLVFKHFERIIQQERSRTKRQAVVPGEITFDEYHRHSVINNYVKAVAKKFSDVATLLNLGKTTEGRDMLGLKISSGYSRPIIIISAGIHAREWIAPAQALYIIQQLVEDGKNSDLIQKVDWIVIPVMNPDGYEYTHTTDRLWRKTRSKGFGNCTGADANRNFDFHWGEKGADTNECSEIYHGHYAFSEPETRNFRDLVIKYAPQTKLVVNFHSFGQLILYPWGHTTELPRNADQLYSLGSDVAKAIENVFGAPYVVGATTQILYHASGECQDWVRGVAGINLTYTVELPPSLDSPIQFLLPSQNIKKVVSETFEGVKVFHSYIENSIN